MGIWMETDKLIVLFIVSAVAAVFCGIAVAAFFFRRGEKRAEREIKEYFDALKKQQKGVGKPET